MNLILTIITLINVFNTHTTAGGGMSTAKGDKHPPIEPSRTYVKLSTDTTSCTPKSVFSTIRFMNPPDFKLLPTYSGKKTYFDKLPTEIKEKIIRAIETLEDSLSSTRIKGGRASLEMCICNDMDYESDIQIIVNFLSHMINKSIAVSPYSSSTVKYSYARFICQVYGIIHSDKLETLSNPDSMKLVALQYLLQQLKNQNNYLINPDDTNQILSLNPEEVTKVTLTFIREPIQDILQPGTIVIFIGFPKVSVLYAIR